MDDQEADLQISRLVRDSHVSQKICIISSDLDMLAMIPREGYYVATIEHNKFSLISKLEALAQVKLTMQQLFFVYCASGCDAIWNHVNGAVSFYIILLAKLFVTLVVDRAGRP